MKAAGLFIVATLVLSACSMTPTRPNPDAQLASRVKQEIVQSEGLTSAKSLAVETHQGVVILSGFVESEKQKDDAGQTALRVSGVNQVFNNLQVPGQTSSGR